MPVRFPQPWPFGRMLGPREFSSWPLESEGQTGAFSSQTETQLPKADLLTFWFLLFGLVLVMTPKG